MFNSSNGYSLADLAAVTGNNGNGGWGNDLGGSWVLILFILLLFGGWGGMGFGGFGGGMGGMLGADMFGGFGLYPWLNNSEHISDGFRDQMTSTQINGLQNSITSGFGDVQLGIAGVNQNICQTGNGIVNAITGSQNAITTQMYNNEIANLNRSFAEQTANAQGFNSLTNQLAQCCCDNRAATADLKYTVATENCADRTAAAQNTRDIIDSQTRGTQLILDKLCALELDGVKNQLAQAQRENAALQNAVNMGAFRESQTAQNALIMQGLNNEVDALYNRLNTCPVPTTPVYGRTPIFTCNNGCGCGNNSTFY